MTHTPGPWKFVQGYGAYNGIAGANNESIANVRAGSGFFNGEANARLIAAAPKMLEALEAVDAEGRDANPNGDVIIPSHVWDLIQQAIAIAKAEGRS